MTARRLLLVSPREPTGATWLINCLLELGVRVHRTSHAPMWIEAADGWTLSPHEDLLKKWLPSLSLRDRFRFRDDIEIRWTHEWPSAETQGIDILLFVRDPRDALLSRFKREASELSFAEFLAFPDPRTLLDKADHWLLFLRCWMACTSVRLLRFEDYKRDARATLRLALAGIGLEPGDDEVGRALEASSFEMAAAAERAYRAAHPEDRELINRGGVPGEWRGLPEYEMEMRAIEARCAGMMDDLSYAVSPGLARTGGGFLAHARLLPFFERLPEGMLQRAAPASADSAGCIGRALAFATSVNARLMERAALPAHERAALAASFGDYLKEIERATPDNLRAAGLAPAQFDWKRPLAPARAIVRRLGKRKT